ncbi:hypothetical protein BN136_402 [Cronobacter universalis NCTC 9529]|nr:hypothetical protein BN136_402 [Cronobacter universalis NCTC 9529]
MRTIFCTVMSRTVQAKRKRAETQAHCPRGGAMNIVSRDHII